MGVMDFTTVTVETASVSTIVGIGIGIGALGISAKKLVPDNPIFGNIGLEGVTNLTGFGFGTGTSSVTVFT
jgi:hypothetical protein